MTPKLTKKFLLKKSYEWNVDDQVAFAKSVITQCLSELDGTVLNTSCAPFEPS